MSSGDYDWKWWQQAADAYAMPPSYGQTTASTEAPAPTSEEMYSLAPVMKPEELKAIQEKVAATYAHAAEEGYLSYMDRYQALARAVRAFPPPPPRALPFVRHPDCSADEVHAGDTLCFHCELIICNEMADKNDGTHTYADWYEAKDWRDQQQPHSLAPTGMCGPVMGRRR